MKAVFTTPWKRTAPEGYVPPQFDPYKVASLLSHLRALLPLVDVLFHASEEPVGYSLNLVVELRAMDDTTVEVSPDLHALLQGTVDRLCQAPETLVVYVPTPDPQLPPVWYQALMIPRLALPEGAAWQVMDALDLPVVVANYATDREFKARAEALTQRVERQLTRWFHEGWCVQGDTLVRSAHPVDMFYALRPPWPEAPPCAVYLRANQDEATAVEALRCALWVYPDDVDGLWDTDHLRLSWVWKGTLEPYTGPAKEQMAEAYDLTALPENHYVLGAEPWTAWAVQKALQQRIPLKRWRSVVLMEGLAATEQARPYAQSGHRVPWVVAPASPWPWQPAPGAPVGVVRGTEEFTQDWASTLATYEPYVVRWVGDARQEDLDAVAASLGGTVRAVLRPDIGPVAHLAVTSPEAVDAWDTAWMRRIRLNA